MSDKLIDISIKIGNSYYFNIIPGKTYNFRVCKDTRVGELKRMFLDCFGDESENTKSIINRYEIYTKKIIRLYDNNIVSDALPESGDSIKEENFFYALLI